VSKVSKVLDRYWLDHYVTHNGLCAPCGNTGVIDTRSVRSPAGVFPGSQQAFCICPNGRAERKIS